jgi:hypothetical protein
MADYAETQTTARSWTRGCRVILDNPYLGKPSMYFQEERVTEGPGGRTSLPAGGVSAAFDPAAMVELIDPETLLPMGAEVPQQMVYLIIFSMYMSLARERDALAAADPTT